MNKKEKKLLLLMSRAFKLSQKHNKVLSEISSFFEQNNLNEETLRDSDKDEFVDCVDYGRVKPTLKIVRKIIANWQGATE